MPQPSEKRRVKSIRKLFLFKSAMMEIFTASARLMDIGMQTVGSFIPSFISRITRTSQEREGN